MNTSILDHLLKAKYTVTLIKNETYFLGVKLRNFRSDETAAVTVDWIVITAAMCILAGAMVGLVRAGAVDLVADLSVVMDANAPE